MAPIERYNIFNYDGIVSIAFKSTPEIDEAILTGQCREVHEAIKALVRRIKKIDAEEKFLIMLAVICFEPPPLLLPDGKRLCDRCYEALPALAHGRRKRHSRCN